jgi:hypothetical protein
LNDDDAKECIGSWTGSRFREYWCEDYRRSRDLTDYMEDGTKTEVDKKKYVSSWLRGYQSVDTLSAFYRHCTYLLYMQLGSLICTAIVLYFEHFHKGGRWQRKDRKGSMDEL